MNSVPLICSGIFLVVVVLVVLALTRIGGHTDDWMGLR